MANLQGVHSLSDKDYLAVQDIIRGLHGCRTRKSLKNLFEFRILPLLKAHSAIYAWTDPDLLSPMLIDSINIPKEDLESVHQFINNDPRAGSLLTHSHPVVARDINIPKDRSVNENEDPFREEPVQFDPFTKDEPKVHDGYGYFGTSKTGMITLSLRDTNLGAGIHRRMPSDKLWTLRDVRVVEHISPHLLMAIKTIVLTEELTRQKSIVDILANSKTAIAVVDSNGVVSYCNATWKELMPAQAGSPLDSELGPLLIKKKLMLEPPFSSNGANGKDAVYKLSGEEYQLSFSPLRGEDDMDFWLLQAKPMRKSHRRMNGLMWQAGLTKREIEACDLFRQGIDANEIAKQLYISPHTVKTHLKRIHIKLGVHTRAQLVAALNRP